MNRILFTILVLASSIAACQLPTPSAGTSAQARPAPRVPSQAAAPDPAEFDKQMAQVQENVTKMQQQMEKLQHTSDPQERQRLLQQHWETMQSAMTSMRGMSAAGMVGCCPGSGPAGGVGPGGHMRGGHMMGATGMGGPMMGGPMMGGPMMGWQRGADSYYSNLTPEQLRQRQYMTDRYVAMQQQMMNHMMWHQHWMSQLPPAKK